MPPSVGPVGYNPRRARPVGQFDEDATAILLSHPPDQVVERIDDAEKEFREALRRNPKMPASLFGLARIYQQQEKYVQALSEIDRAAQLAPKSKNVHFVRGRILLKLGRREEAQKEMDLAQKIIDVSFEKDREATALKNGVVRNPELTQEPE